MKVAAKTKVKTIVGIVGMTLILFEIALRLTGIFNTYSERAAGNFNSPFNQKMGSWYFMEKPNSQPLMRTKEFSYSYHIDSLGCLHHVFSGSKTDTISILVLGDSFTFGIGSPEDSSWAYLLGQNISKRSKKNVEIINASKQGSDPFFSYMVYKDKLSNLKVDFFLLTINSTDLLEVYARGGYERFKSDSTSATRPAPWFFPFYRYSHVVRYFLKVFYGIGNDFLYRNSDQGQLNKEANKKILDCLSDIYQCAHQRNQKLIVINFLLPNEVRFNLSSSFSAIDSVKHRYEYINIDADMRKFYSQHDLTEYFWNLDGHFNSRGYKVFGDIVFDKLTASDSSFRNATQ